MVRGPSEEESIQRCSGRRTSQKGYSHLALVMYYVLCMMGCASLTGRKRFSNADRGI